VLRGFALLGILLANIDDFGTPEATHDIPIGMAIPAFDGPQATLNFVIVLLKWIFVEGKMRGIFSMLFGAGVLLLTERIARRGGDGIAADIYTRRNFWLLMFGVLHGCLLWHGDILFDYAIVALLFLYPLRKMSPKFLLYVGTVVSLTIGTYAAMNLVGGLKDFPLSRQAAAITATLAEGRPVTPRDKQVLDAWNARVKSHTVTQESVQAAVADGTKPYWDKVTDNLQTYLGRGAGPIRFLGITDTLGMIMIGMGLYKLGFLTGDLSRRTYAWTAFAGFLVSAPMYVAGLWKASLTGFNFLALDTWVFLPYYLTRELGTVALAALVILLVKSGVDKPLQQALANVGKMALSNYLLTTVICQFIFVWGPWPLYARLTYLQLHYVVFGVWAFNLAFSALWLRAYQFGPVEWAWRSLTYARLQPMRKSAKGALASV